MEIFLQNNLSGAKEAFKPIQEKKTGLYSCGPTVYNYAHIGNLRAYVLSDILRRTLEYAGYKVSQIINITDVGHLTSDSDQGADKIEEEAKKENKNAKEIAEFYTSAFFEDLQKLNIKTEGTIFPKASEHITEQIELVKKLEEKGFTYKTSDGIYFDTSKFRDYGKLGKTNIEGLESGARVEINSEKKNITDFALWKFSQPHEKRQQEWESPWGIGFPGWHIECSAMSMKYLGETFDIHTGGIDHIPVHHNNEIAQSESATGKPFVNYWLHNAFVNIEGGKMAKSEGNFVRLETLLGKGINPLSYRYLLLTARYNSPLNFKWEALESANKALTKLAKDFFKLGQASSEANPEYLKKFEDFIADDLDTPKAIALIWELIKDQSIENSAKRKTLIEFDKILGLDIEKLSQQFSKKIKIPKEIENLAKEREEARTNEDWRKSDELRDKITELGYIVTDTKDGQEISSQK